MRFTKNRLPYSLLVFCLLHAALSFALGESAKAPSAKKVEEQPVEVLHISCFINKDPQACISAFWRTSEQTEAHQIAEFACNKLNSEKACSQYRESFPANSSVDPAVEYREMCKNGLPGGCFNVILDRRHLVDSLTPPQILAQLDEVQLLKQGVCKPELVNSELCVKTGKLIDEMKELANPNRKTCSLAYQAFRTDAVEYNLEFKQFTQPPAESERRLTPEECRKRCENQIAKIDEDNTFLLRGRCALGDTTLGEPILHWVTAKECPARGMTVDVGKGNQNFFARCHCFGLPLPTIDELLKKHGVFSAGKPTASKPFGKDVFYRCAYVLYYDDPLNARKNPKGCGENLSVIKKSIASQSKEDYDFDLTHVDCGRKE